MRPASWRESEPPRADFFAVKAVLAALLDALRVPWSVEAAREPFLHPGRSARVLVGGEPAGLARRDPPRGRARVGPRRRRRGLRARRSAPIERAATQVPRYEDVISYPAVLQDRAWWFAPTCRPPTCWPPCARRAARCCAHAEIFDVYPAEGRVSLAVRLEFRADDRTLTDEEVAQRRAKIDAAVAERLGGEPRG